MTLADEQNIIFQEYVKSNTYVGKIDGADISMHQGNSICGDDITIYLNIIDQDIVAYSFDGNTSMVTHASASFLGDLISQTNIYDVLKWTEKTILAEGFVVSKRRRRASIIALLSCRNAIHQYLQDGLHDDFEDLLDGYDDDQEHMSSIETEI